MSAETNATHPPVSGDGVEIPISADGQTTLPLAEIVTGRGAIVGKSGGGKSNSATVTIEGLLDHGIPVLIVDVDGEYVSLKEEYEVLHAGATDECDVTVDAGSGATIAATVLEKSVPMILDVSEFFDDDAVTELIADVARRLFIREKTAQKPMLLVLEECHELIPQRGKDDASEMLIKIAKRGRKRGLGILGLSQRPADVDKAFITQADWVVFHRLTWSNDTAVVKDVIDADHAKSVQDLEAGEAFVRTDWDNQVRRVQWRYKTTPDYGAAPSIGRALGSTPKRIGADVYADFAPSEEADLPESVADYLDHLLDEVRSLDTYERYLLDFIYENGPTDPEKGYILAGGKPNSNTMYEKIRTLRDLRFVTKVASGTCNYGLPDRVDDQLQFNPEAEDKHLAAVVERVEEEFAGVADAPEEEMPAPTRPGETLGTHNVLSRGQNRKGYVQVQKAVGDYLNLSGGDSVAVKEGDCELVLSKAEDDENALARYSAFQRGDRDYVQFTLGMIALSALGAGAGDAIRFEAAGDGEVRAIVAEMGGD